MFDTRVYINLEVEALHAFFRANEPEFKEVAYLQYPHRHTFGFKVELKVTHDDRDVEFIMFKHQIQNFLMNKYFNMEIGMCDFTGKSCEMLGQEVIEYCLELGLQPVAAWVDEDGENGAHIIWNEERPDWSPGEKAVQMEIDFPDAKEAKVYVVVGYAGSGKSTVAHLLSNVMQVDVVEVSTLISNINNFKIKQGQLKDREKLANAISSSELAVELDEYIKIDQGKSIIISGLRDFETYSMLVEKYGREKFHVVQVACKPHVAAERLHMTLNDYMTGPAQIDIKLRTLDIMADANYIHMNG